MLSGFPAHTFWRSRPFSRNANAERELLLRPGDHLRRVQSSPDEPDLLELNESLAILATIFPDVRPEVFREMLSAFSPESRLQLVTESLLRHKKKWVRGRWNVSGAAEKDAPGLRSGLGVAPNEQFRSSGYRAAVKAAFYQEFKGLSHSTIKAVLAEHNYSYSETRPALLTLVSKSWRFSISSVVFRRKTPSAADHPLVQWRSRDLGVLEPSLNPTESQELNHELEAVIIAPLKRRKADEQLRQDQLLAVRLNEEQAQQEDAQFDCECCFNQMSFEQITSCDSGGHYICFSCIRHTMTEAIYGQGWPKSVNRDRSALKCVAVSMGHGDECQGCIPQDLVRRAIYCEPSGEDIWRKYEDRIAHESLAQCQANLLRCPFCVYAEFDDRQAPGNRQRNKLNVFLLLAFLGAGLCLLDLFVDLMTFKLAGLLAFLLAAISGQRHLMQLILGTAAVENTAHSNHGRKFTCRKPTCLRVSCLRCSTPWTDIHVCYQSSRQALRTYVEGAITEAIKRTCPKCNLAFVKSSGCNKLVCVCGYAMCYVCRKEIGKESYLHFCQHFRANPGEACTECERCDLYRTEDEDLVIKRAKERAVRDWKEQEATRDGSEKVMKVAWSIEEEADNIGNRVVSRRKVGWLPS